jgi:hypothetical protein
MASSLPSFRVLYADVTRDECSASSCAAVRLLMVAVVSAAASAEG